MIDFLCIYPMCLDDRRRNTRTDLGTNLLSSPDPVLTRNPDPSQSLSAQSGYVPKPAQLSLPDAGHVSIPSPGMPSSCIPTKRSFHEMESGIREGLEGGWQPLPGFSYPGSMVQLSTSPETPIISLGEPEVRAGVHHSKENGQTRSPLLAPIPEESPEEPEEEPSQLRPGSTPSAPGLELSPSTGNRSVSESLPSASMGSTSSIPAVGSGTFDLTSTTQSLPLNSLSPDSDDNGDASSAASTANDSDSVFDESDNTSNYTASLLSDVKNYTYENGRRYHSYREGLYVLPNDEPEQDRQDLLHHVRNLVLNGRLFKAPLEPNIQRALDIGTGTGIWAIDFADSYPCAEVTGTDLSPIQPSWVPPNLRFVVDDAESPWLYSPNRPFDFIHARDLGGAIADWPRLIRQSYEHLRPGGWIELQEFEVMLKSDDDSIRLAPALCEFLDRLTLASEAFHRPMNIAEGHRQRLVEAGFEDVRDEVYKVRPSPSPVFVLPFGLCFFFCLSIPP
jgi:SAM-dependent methyltransferase